MDDLICFDIIKVYDEIIGVGYCVVVGGEYFKELIVVEGDVLEKVEELSLLVFFYNLVNAVGVCVFKELLLDIISVVVFDILFYISMLEKVYCYFLLIKYYIENKVCKYGVYGISY